MGSSRNNSMYTRRPGGERSKRQERVGQFVQSELAKLLHSGNIKGYAAEPLDDDLRQRISIIKSDLSPDLRQARISISVRGSSNNSRLVDNGETTTSTGGGGSSRAVDRRRAYAWLVRNTKPIRYSLAQQLKHMKYCPDLTFVEVDVTAAVDVMALIDQVSSSSSSKRSDNLYDPEQLPQGVVDGIDFDDGDFADDEDWEDEDFDDEDDNDLRFGNNNNNKP
jgi:ribosome-binding factor A